MQVFSVLDFGHKRCYLRVRSVSLGVNSGQVSALLDVDVQAPRHHVVDESELQLPLHWHSPISPLPLTVHTGHGLGSETTELQIGKDDVVYK